MSPEYGATIAICPIDDMTLDYLRLTARDEAQVKLVEAYAKEQGLFRTADSPDPIYTQSVELDLTTVEPSLAGPKRPQDRVSLNQSKLKFQQALEVMLAERKAKPAKEKPGETTTPGETKTVTAGAPAAVAHSESEAPGMEGLDHGVGRRRRDHELHQHVEPERDDRRRPARAERRAARASRRSRG